MRAQLMAQPAPDLAGRTIASLSDNTPLITRDRLGQGQVVLIHVTANAEWSNLPLSGLFLQMMDRLVATARLSPTEAATEDITQPFWTPEAMLDGFGARPTPRACPRCPLPIWRRGRVRTDPRASMRRANGARR